MFSAGLSKLNELITEMTRLQKSREHIRFGSVGEIKMEQKSESSS